MRDVRPGVIFTLSPTSMMAFAATGAFSVLAWYGVVSLVFRLL